MQIEFRDKKGDLGWTLQKDPMLLTLITLKVGNVVVDIDPIIIREPRWFSKTFL